MSLLLSNDSLGPLEDGHFDRLADGTLNEADRRALLLRLDAEPNGWRRCALSFLQAQAFDEAFKMEDSKIPAFLYPKKKKIGAARWALAASALIATFGIGVVSGRQGPPKTSTVERPNLVKIDEVKKPIEPDNPKVAEQPVARTVAYLEVTADGEHTVRVPVWSGPGLDEHWLQNQPPALSKADRRRFERLGYSVEEDRRFLSLKLRDGRRVSFPVEQVQLKYVGKPVL